MANNILTSTAEACRTILEHSFRPSKIEKPLADCYGYRLAQDIYSRVTHPPFDLSAMDGFAVRYDDACEIGQTLRVVGEVTAGQNFEGTIARGEAVKISTGGYMPTGLDHVLIQEHARYDGQIVIVDHKQLNPRNIRRAGLDFSKGEKLVEAGSILGPAELAISAASTALDSRSR